MATWIPEGWHSVTPRLVVDDVPKLVRFLERAFGAAGDVHDDRPAQMRIGDSIVMVSGVGPRDAMPSFLYLYVADADATCARALAAGAVSIEEPADMPYGDRRGMIKDPCGNIWQIATYRAQRRTRSRRQNVKRSAPRRPRDRGRGRRWLTTSGSNVPRPARWRWYDAGPRAPISRASFPRRAARCGRQSAGSRSNGPAATSPCSGTRRSISRSGSRSRSRSPATRASSVPRRRPEWWSRPAHIGPYERLGQAHAAIRAWCARHRCELAGPNWEIYGHWDEDPSRLRTDVFYLVRPADACVET